MKPFCRSTTTSAVRAGSRSSKGWSRPRRVSARSTAQDGISTLCMAYASPTRARSSTSPARYRPFPSRDGIFVSWQAGQTLEDLVGVDRAVPVVDDHRLIEIDPAADTREVGCQ